MPTRTATPVAEPEVTADAVIAEAPEPAMAHETDLAAAALKIFNEDWEGLSLQSKIARIAGHVGTIEKRGYNKFHHYHYVLESDLVAALRQYLSAAGIVIIPDVFSIRTINPEGSNPITRVKVKYTVTDGKEEFSFRMPGEGADKGDKGVYKAVTGSQKYALMKLFKIETGDDPEGDTRVDERAATDDKPRRQTTVRSGDRAGVQRGGHTDTANETQIRRIAALNTEIGLGKEALVNVLARLFQTKISLTGKNEEDGQAIVAALRALTAEQAGQLITELETLIAATEGTLGGNDAEPGSLDGEYA